MAMPATRVSRLIAERTIQGFNLYTAGNHCSLSAYRYAVVHWSWKMSGDKHFDGTARPPRFGLMTLVVEKRDGAWQIVVAQNTNALLGTPSCRTSRLRSRYL